MEKSTTADSSAGFLETLMTIFIVKLRFLFLSISSVFFVHYAPKRLHRSAISVMRLTYPNNR